ncbi:TonB-dependent receptor plug domain-containing protein [Flavobacterium hibernum]|uniref:TonB-dependent receptor plug domain-containing protein n=1 Tax=Flavobacterium hibernum TaxID=37752 RepID=A0A0D0F0U0_9FLAO|nr:TonB-dependent receptor plug domain-containing protein [Flavobacterium hibernum]KIO53211.1 hypothetical protein IW18_07820 [Flavobacterium hibernum]OXA87809.1 hypothetical protein B0A73_08430 [Flavobacterium hibernum]PTT14459.1 hypothetical protein DBR27_04120 [Flavobacterium sp. HMWF030]STO10391.1 Outer membrane cobalamin receptor protein [Flavobacterium hibernum]
MKKVKLISFGFSMLISFVIKAQEKTVSKVYTGKEPIELPVKSFAKTKDTICTVKVSSNFVQPKTPQNFRIICARTITNQEEPLYIIDEVIVNSKQFSKVNPNDIESIKVLKGIEATSLYGSQGVNGVVIITTKDKD